MRPLPSSPNDPTATRLRALFRQALQLSALSAAVSACNSETTPAPIDELDSGPGARDGGAADAGLADEPDLDGSGPFELELEPEPGFDPVSCDVLSQLEFVQPFDYVSLRMTSDGEEASELDAEGVACAGASDPMACATELAVVPQFPEQGFDFESILYLTTTRGDEVKRYFTDAEVLGALGTIDTENEAALLARFARSPNDNRFGIDCTSPELSGVRVIENGYQVIATSTVSTCPVTSARVLLEVTSDGEVRTKDQVIYRRTDLCVGRRPSGMSLGERRAVQGELGSFFAELAELEAASITAFRVLVRELSALGAPSDLVTRARQAARDEVRHARTMRAFARRFGAEPRHPAVERQALRSTYALALDNAVEGCVRETFGALYGAFQAEHATDPAVRNALRDIADDETRHASLAHDLASWLAPRLSDEEARAVRDAQADALDSLRDQLADDDASVLLRSVAGVPSRAESLALFSALHGSLWSVPAAA